MGCAFVELLAAPPLLDTLNDGLLLVSFKLRSVEEDEQVLMVADRQLESQSLAKVVSTERAPATTY